MVGRQSYVPPENVAINKGNHPEQIAPAVQMSRGARKCEGWMGRGAGWGQRPSHRHRVVGGEQRQSSEGWGRAQSLTRVSRVGLSRGPHAGAWPRGEARVFRCHEEGNGGAPSPSAWGSGGVDGAERNFLGGIPQPEHCHTLIAEPLFIHSTNTR